MIEIIKKLFSRDLNKLKNEIELYQNEMAIWQIIEGITNSGGNLCLHLIGNLNTYIGAELGMTNYVRNRELEFSSKNISKVDLLKKIKDTIDVVEKSLDKLTNEDLKKEYPNLVLDEMTSTEFLLVHLLAHLSYHLGQINYHRRLLDQ